MKRLACIALILAACGDRPFEDAPGALGGAAGEAMATGGTSAGTGGAAGAGGQGGSPEPISKAFTRDDRFLCLDWPVCPDGVLNAADPRFIHETFTWCRDRGIPVSCGACIDTRTAACAPFVGRCKAPNWPVDRSPDFCADQVAAPRNVVDHFTICTGDLGAIGPDSVAGSDALTVCGDGP